MALETPGLHPSSESLGFLSPGEGGEEGIQAPWEGKPTIRSLVPLTQVGNPLCPSSPNVSSSRENLEPETETESVVSLRRERPRRRDSSERGGEGGQAWRPARLGVWEGSAPTQSPDKGEEPESWFLRFLFSLSGGPPSQRPLEAGAPPGRVRELLHPHDQ